MSSAIMVTAVAVDFRIAGKRAAFLMDINAAKSGRSYYPPPATAAMPTCAWRAKSAPEV